MKKRAICMALSLLLLTGLTGCGNWDDTSQFDVLSRYYQSENEEPIPELTDFALAYCSSETLDPITCSDGFQLSLSGLLYEGLYELDETWTARCQLADGYYYDPESFTYTVTIRSDATFSDGSAVSADDVLATLERARLSARYGARFANVETMGAEGDTVLITLKEDNRLFINLLDIPIVKSGTENRIVPIGSGPYVVDHDEKGNCLVPNENRWKKENLPLSRITLLSYNNQESAAYAFSARDVQMAFCDLTATNATALTGSGNVTDAATTVLHYIGFNTNRDFFMDAGVRRALNLSIDRESLISAYLLGHAEAAQFPLSPKSTLYPQDLEQITSADIFYDAMQALGLTAGEEIQYATMIVNEENPFKVSMAQAIAEAMSTCDLQVTVSVLPWEAYLTALEDEEYDMYYGEVKMTADWDSSDLFCAGGALNYSVYSEPELELAMLNYLTSGESGREDSMRRLCLRFQQDMPIIPLCYANRSLLLSAGAVDGANPTASNPFYDFENWTVHLSGVQ